MKVIHVAVGLVTNANNQLLIALRPPQVYMPGYWEFPGGKIEAGEDAKAALKRELKEEVGIEVQDASLFLQHEHQYPERHVFLETWQVTSYTGKPRGCEQQQIKWVYLHELADYKFPEGNFAIIEALLKQEG